MSTPYAQPPSLATRKERAFCETGPGALPPARWPRATPATEHPRSMSSLGTALGSPNPARLLPARRSPEWRWYCRTIEDFSRCPGILSGRGAEWLWKKLQRSAPPPQISWGALLVGWGEADEARVRAALRETICLDDVVITSWNVRWLVDPNSTRATGKKRVIEERLALGQIVCIQETHWSDADEAVWKHGLMIRSIFASSAYNGDGQRRQQRHRHRRRPARPPAEA